MGKLLELRERKQRDPFSLSMICWWRYGEFAGISKVRRRVCVLLCAGADLLFFWQQRWLFIRSMGRMLWRAEGSPSGSGKGTAPACVELHTVMPCLMTEVCCSVMLLVHVVLDVHGWYANQVRGRHLTWTWAATVSFRVEIIHYYLRGLVHHCWGQYLLKFVDRNPRLCVIRS